MARSTKAFMAGAAVLSGLMVQTVAAEDFYYRFHPRAIGLAGTPATSGPTVALAAATIPSPRANRPWSYDFTALASTMNVPPGMLGWSASGLPAWASLDPATGIVSGTPVARGAQSLTVSARYQGAFATETFRFSVLDPSLALAPSALPAASVGDGWRFDFGALASKQDLETPGLDWASADKPQWMTIEPGTGLASGTPTATGDASFTVAATNVDAAARRTYTISAGGATLRIAQLALGGAHSCAVTAGGAVKCWGPNPSGQIGDGTTTSRSVPTTVSELEAGVLSIAAGGSTTCAVKSDRTLWCWGDNSAGKLGNGSTANSNVPTPVSGLGQDVASVSVGIEHACAITTAGAAYCWGEGSEGRLGNGASSRSLTRVAVSGASSGIASIAAGELATCALRTSGGLVCWGFGQQNAIGTSTNVPLPVPGHSSGIASVEMGQGNGCLLTAGGAMSCWGSNANGQLGDDSTMSRATPVAVSGFGSGVASMSVGGYATCAVTATCAARCWNLMGEVGDGTTTTQKVPTPVSGLSAGVSTIATSKGGVHSCAGLASGGGRCGGQGSAGRLGTGSTQGSTTPVDVLPGQ